MFHHRFLPDMYDYCASEQYCGQRGISLSSNDGQEEEGPTIVCLLCHWSCFGVNNWSCFGVNTDLYCGCSAGAEDADVGLGDMTARQKAFRKYWQ